MSLLGWHREETGTPTTGLLPVVNWYTLLEHGHYPSPPHCLCRLDWNRLTKFAAWSCFISTLFTFHPFQVFMAYDYASPTSYISPLETIVGLLIGFPFLGTLKFKNSIQYFKTNIFLPILFLMVGCSTFSLWRLGRLAFESLQNQKWLYVPAHPKAHCLSIEYQPGPDNISDI